MNDDENWEMVGYCPKDKDPGFGEFQGKVEKVLPSGCAFVTCQEVKDMYDQDAYVHNSVVQQCSLQAGEEICFNIHVSSSGRPQVSAPCWKRRKGLKRPGMWQAGGYSGNLLVGANGGKSTAKGQSGPTGQVVKARRLVESLNPTGAKGAGKGFVSVQAEQEGGFGAPGEYLIGTIKICSHEKGFSLIACPETGLPQDVYVPGSVANPQAFAVGDIVAFAYGMGQRGPQASSVFKMVGYLQPEKEVQFPPYQGLIHRILPNGNGFIKCEEVLATYGRDAFVHKTVVAQCGLNVEDVIAFDVHISKDGNPQASAPCWQQIAPTCHFQGFGAKGKGKGAQPTPQTFQSPVGMAGKGKAAPIQLNMSKGGTVRVTEPNGASAKGGVIIGSKGFKGTTKGTVKGTPKGAPKAVGKGGPKPGAPRDSWGAEASANKVDDLEVDWLPDDFHAGRVSLVDVSKNVSMVRCPPASNLSRDVYVHQSVAEPSAVALNDVVCFKIHLNKHGLPQASAPLWKRIGTDPSDSVVRFGEFQGLVSRSGDGSIFIDCTEVTDLHGKQASMSEETLNACSLLEGNFISFDVQCDENGDPEASLPCWICCSSEKWVADLLSKGLESKEPEGDV